MALRYSTWVRRTPLKIIDAILIDRENFSKGLFTPEKSLGWKTGLGFNSEHFSLAVKGSDPLDVMKSILPEYLEEAHSRGFKVFVYINVHWHDVSDLEKHRDWFQVDYSGKVIDDVYGKGLMPCVNSPGWREYSYNIIKGIAELGPDGIFLDGPVFHWRGCYCSYCRKLFKEKYGIELPRKGDLSNPNHLKLVEFQRESMVNYMKRAFEVVKSVDPEIAIYLNGEPARPSWATGRDNVRLSKYQDLVGAEGGFEYYDLFETPVFKPGMTAKLLEAQAPDKPRVIFIAAKHSPWNKEVLTPAELANRCAQTIANGAYYWIGYTYDGRLNSIIKKINSWVDKCGEYLVGTHDVSDVAVYWSQATGDIYGGEVPVSDFTGETKKVKRDYLKSIYGAYELLVRSRIPFKFVISPSQLNGIRLLVLPNVAFLSEEEAEGIRDFVKKGGVLFATYETSLYDIGGKRDDFLLGDLLGVRYVKDHYYGTYENYMLVEGEYYPATPCIIETETVTGKVAGIYSKNTGGFYQPIEWSNIPSLIYNSYGKGGVVYFPGNFFQTYYNYRFKSYLDLFNKLLNRFYKRNIVLDTPSSCIEVTLRAKGEDLLLHLVNYSSGLSRPLLNIIPVPVNISLKGEYEVETVIGRKTEVSRRDYTKVSFILEEYGLLVLRRT